MIADTHWNTTGIERYRVRALNLAHIVEYFTARGNRAEDILEGVVDARRALSDPDSYLPLKDFYRVFANCHRLNPHLTLYDWQDIAQQLHRSKASRIMRTLVWLAGPRQLYAMAGSYIMRVNNYGRMRVWEMSRGRADMISEVAPAVVAVGAGIYLRWAAGILASLPAANGGKPADVRILYDHARLKNVVEQLYGLSYRETEGAIWVDGAPAARRIRLASESRDGATVFTDREAESGAPNAVLVTRDVVSHGHRLLKAGDVFDAPQGRLVVSWDTPSFWRRWQLQIKRLLPLNQTHRQELDHQIQLAERRYFESETLRAKELAVMRELKAANRRLEAEIKERRRFEAEKNALADQLQEAQKMKALGTLAGGIAHDFNNILFPIIGFAEMTLEEVAGQAEAMENQKEILQAAHRAKNLVQQILDFSRQEKEAFKPIRLHRVVQEALVLVRASLPTTIDIRCDAGEDCGPILGDATKIHQILMNLCTNALHAMKDGGGTLTLTVSPATVDGCAFVSLVVSDTGTGISPELRARIFDPYFTTKAQGEGTGLGLSVVHGLVAAHDGRISVESTPGEGTAVTVLLPVHHWASEATAPPPAVKPPSGTGTLLVVDDEEQILRMLAKSLTRLGYEVETHTSGDNALAAVQADPLRWHAVITDFTMPHMTGLALAERLEVIRPELPVILCTGFSERLESAGRLRANIATVLFKPVTAKALACVLQEAIAPATVNDGA